MQANAEFSSLFSTRHQLLKRRLIPLKSQCSFHKNNYTYYLKAFVLSWKRLGFILWIKKGHIHLDRESARLRASVTQY